MITHRKDKAKMARVLVVDDEESIRYTFTDFLRAAGHSVTTANGLKESLERITETDFDVVFADVLLNDGNGIRLLEEVIRLNPVCRVIMMSGDPNHDTHSDVLRRGACEYLRKPVNQEMLLGVMDLTLQRRL